MCVFDTEPETLELEAKSSRYVFRDFTTAAKLRGSCEVGTLAVVTFDIARKKNLGEWASHCSSPFIKCIGYMTTGLVYQSSQCCLVWVHNVACQILRRYRPSLLRVNNDDLNRIRRSAENISADYSVRRIGDRSVHVTKDV